MASTSASREERKEISTDNVRAMNYFAASGLWFSTQGVALGYIIWPFQGRNDQAQNFGWKDCLVARWRCWLPVLLCLLFSGGGAIGAESSSSAKRPLKVLFLTGGGYHDYEKLAPHLTTQLHERIAADFTVKFGLQILSEAKFADPFDAVIYDVCDDEVPDASLENALQSIRAGKPTVMIHCAVHAFRRSPKISEWETACGMRSKVHDAFGPFVVRKIDPTSPITRPFPEEWKTGGDELYQTISIDPKSHILLRAKSPRDGRDHVVCWTSQYGQGRVFATTLGHDMTTAATPDYLRLVANGLLWSCGHLSPDGNPAPGYSAAPAK